MPVKDIYHNHVKNALVKDGWVITHDPLMLKWGLKDLYIDLGAEQLLAKLENKTTCARRKIAIRQGNIVP